MIKPAELNALKLQQKESLKKKRKAMGANSQGGGAAAANINLADEISFVDTSKLEFYKRIKETLLAEDSKVPVLVRLHEEEYARKVRHDLAFQNTFMADKYQLERRQSLNPNIAVLSNNNSQAPQNKRILQPY